MSEAAIKVSHVSKHFILPHEKITSVKGVFTSIARRRAKTTDVQHALQDITFEVKKGEFFGIVGRNGSGKSTLLKILANIYQPSSGSVEHEGKLVPFIELGVGFNPELTGRENVYLNGAMLGFSRKTIDKMYADIVTFAELERFMDQKLKNYSSGMQVRLAFSMATRSQADILLVDEVLAVGDADFQRKCYSYFSQLKKNHTTVVFVTHDMNAVREYCDRAILIESNRLVAQGSADEIASRYTKLFTKNNIQEETAIPKKHWGEGGMKFKDIHVQTKKPHGKNEGTEKILLTVAAQATANGISPIIGFAVKNASGTPVTGTNSQIKKTKLGPLKRGQAVVLEWTIPNIFSDGQFDIDVAATAPDGTVYEWWEDAVKLRSSKEEHVPYSVLPEIDLKVTYVK